MKRHFIIAAVWALFLGNASLAFAGVCYGPTNYSSMIPSNYNCICVDGIWSCNDTNSGASLAIPDALKQAIAAATPPPSTLTPLQQQLLCAQVPSTPGCPPPPQSPKT